MSAEILTGNTKENQAFNRCATLFVSITLLGTLNCDCEFRLAVLHMPLTHLHRLYMCYTYMLHIGSIHSHIIIINNLLRRVMTPRAHPPSCPLRDQGRGGGGPAQPP
jgi:hypothetical protein